MTDERTREDVQKDIDNCFAQLRVIRSDADRDILRVEREHMEAVRHMVGKLERLQHKRIHGGQLIVAYEARMREIESDIQVLKQQKKLKQLLDLIKKINKSGGDVAHRIDPILESVASTNERLAELRGLLVGYANEMKEVKRAMNGTFERREARLVERIERRRQQFATFLCHKADPWGAQRIVWDRINALREELKTVKVTATFNRQLSATLNEIDRLSSLITDEQLSAIFQNIKS